jgi:glucose-1-phosphate thymidylyltransferase
VKGAWGPYPRAVSRSPLDERLAGVLLAGGSGSRLQPLTARTNKHLVPVYLRPMIEYPLGTLLNAGLREVLVVSGRQHLGQVVDLLGSGAAYGEGVDFTYKVQDEALGIAHAIGLAERFAAGRRVAVLLGDNVMDDDGVPEAIRAFAALEPAVATCFLARVPDAKAYGVATVEGGRIVRIVEKPRQPESDLAVTGLYLYPPDVFDRVRRLTPSARGELEVTDLNNAYVAEGRMRYLVVERWFDAGEPGPWMRTQRYVEEHPERFTSARFRLREDGDAR